jgi:hypothetical protein
MIHLRRRINHPIAATSLIVRMHPMDLHCLNEQRRGMEVGLESFDRSVGEQSQATKRHPMGGASTQDTLTRTRLIDWRYV